MGTAVRVVLAPWNAGRGALSIHPVEGGGMSPHEQPRHTIPIDNRLVTAGAMLTAAGALVAGTGITVVAFAVLSAGRRMIRDMDVPPAQQAAMKWRQAKEASQAGLQAWHSASDAHNVAPSR